MNDTMSLGVHRLWKDSFVSLLRPDANESILCIDVAGGTGTLPCAPSTTRVDVVDINGEMLKEGYARFKKTMYHNSARFLEQSSDFLCARRTGCLTREESLPASSSTRSPASYLCSCIVFLLGDPTTRHGPHGQSCVVPIPRRVDSALPKPR
ncbi:hypothetical protein DFH94DRAFT_773776 [Russula ochroleuca]|uniref:Uncharacterized protein n=1 Tax=Russula ochroleuca TaxID=152965 RepID=A0A9P5MPK8_9AGAM|nr:hypothetical protein DFH94DRAFT_773776 [Russula ochroleuca]